MTNEQQEVLLTPCSGGARLHLYSKRFPGYLRSLA